MIAYVCKYCGKFTVFGYVNKYDEHFCSEKCYKKYCEFNNYNYDNKDISEIYKKPPIL